MNWKRTLLTWIIVFGAFLLLSSFLSRSKNPPELKEGAFAAITSKNEYSVGSEVILRLKNNTPEKISLPLDCPKNPFHVTKLIGNEWKLVEAESKILCKGPKEITVEPGKETPISYTYWTYALFEEPGRYKIEIPLDLSEKTSLKTSQKTSLRSVSSNEFTIKPQGTFGKIWDNFIYKPLLNLLIFLATTLPGKSLGAAIIILTIIIRLILLVPSQRAIQSQKKMQDLQPKLEGIRKKYEGNKERVAQETMALWKEEKVNPMGSCLPLLIQFPILIALYYVIRNGINPDNTHLLYGSLKNIDFSVINTHFLKILELTAINAFVLPIAVGLLQYIQMKMAVAKKTSSGEKGSEMQMANSMMTYVMPVMIALFTASVPAGVGLYWGISTVFGIGQQLYVNLAAKREKLM